MKALSSQKVTFGERIDITRIEMIEILIIDIVTVDVACASSVVFGRRERLAGCATSVLAYIYTSIYRSIRTYLYAHTYIGVFVV